MMTEAEARTFLDGVKYGVLLCAIIAGLWWMVAT